MPAPHLPLGHPYETNVGNCSLHDMGDCPYHDDTGACRWRNEPDDPECGQSKTAHHAAPWRPGPRPPIGQYRITVTVTGDDIGADMHDWLLNRLYDTVGMTACADTIEPLTDAPQDRAITLRLHQDDNTRTRALYAGDREIASTTYDETGHGGLDLFDELTAAIADATGTPLTTCPRHTHSHP